MAQWKLNQISKRFQSMRARERKKTNSLIKNSGLDNTKVTLAMTSLPAACSSRLRGGRAKGQKLQIIAEKKLTQTIFLSNGVTSLEFEPILEVSMVVRVLVKRKGRREAPLRFNN